MIIKQLLTIAFRSLTHHKLRSLLTTLGIIIGIVAIIAVMSIAEGAKSKIQKQIEGLGANFVIILGTQPKKLAQQRMGGQQLRLTHSDYDAIVEECDALYLASAALMQPNLTIVYQGKNWQTIGAGVQESYFDIRSWQTTNGETFSFQDDKTGTKVAVIGKTVATELFEEEDPVGKKIRINKLPFTIIGVLSGKGKRPDGFDEDDIIFMPLKTVQRKLTGTTKFSAIIASAKSKELIDKAAQQIKSVLRQQHRLLAKDDDDFTVFTQNDIAQASQAASKILNLLLFIIASISLIVGGIGIMNIMLVSVTERTKEIGVRLALGATKTSIMRQFILESIIICLIGGLIGIAGGVSIAKLVGFLSGWPIIVPTSAVLISLGSCTIIGLFFGYYPARKASMLDPVLALMDR